MSGEPLSTGEGAGTHLGRGFWVAVVVGWGVMAFGVWNLLGEPDWAAEPSGFFRLYVGSAIVNDLVLLPLVLAVGIAVSRWVPALARAPVQAGLVVSGMVTLYAWPYVRGYGSMSNPFVLSLDYGRNLALILGATWSVVAVAVAWRLVRNRSRPQEG